MSTSSSPFASPSDPNETEEKFRRTSPLPPSPPLPPPPPPPPSRPSIARSIEELMTSAAPSSAEIMEEMSSLLSFKSPPSRLVVSGVLRRNKMWGNCVRVFGVKKAEKAYHIYDRINGTNVREHTTSKRLELETPGCSQVLKPCTFSSEPDHHQPGLSSSIH